MIRGGNARAAILRSVRDALAESAPHEEAYAEAHARAAPRGSLPVLPHGHALSPEWVSEVAESHVEQFGARLEAVGGHWSLAANLGDACATVRAFLEESGARRVALSDSALVAAVLEGAAPADVELLRQPTQRQLFECDLGVSSAQWAIAESGTLVLDSDCERNRLVSLIPPLHLAVVPLERLVATLGEALARLQPEGAEACSRAVTFITGPSRTADIEQRLIMGVHGPQSLLVLFVTWS